MSEGIWDWRRNGSGLSSGVQTRVKGGGSHKEEARVVRPYDMSVMGTALQSNRQGPNSDSVPSVGRAPSSEPVPWGRVGMTK